MENINIEATDRSPEVVFDFAANTFLIKGESYPEDVTTFYNPVLSALQEYLEGDGASAKSMFTFELVYFNSSTAKILMEIFDSLEEAAQAGASIHVTWCYDEEDDTMEELGEEFAEDLDAVTFELIVVEA